MLIFMKQTLSLSLMKGTKTQTLTKSNFETSNFKPNEVKPYLPSTQYLEKLKNLMSYLSIFNVLNVILKT